MYVPPPYQEHRREVLVGAIAARSFGTLVSCGAGGIGISHVPFAIAADGAVLDCHLARSNPQWRDLAGGAEAVASFLVDDAYISPGWYPSKAETGRAVPTWNYVAVEARGRVELIEDGPALLALLGRLTDRHETGRAEPWSTADAPADYLAAMLKGIVGIRLHVTALTGAWKLDQKNRADDRAGAAAGLAAEPGGSGIAGLMRG